MHQMIFAREAARDPVPAKRWAVFLSNHREVIAAMDSFTVPMLTFGVLHCFFVIAHVENGRLNVDLGRATAIALPEQETVRRWKEVTPQWPIMHVLLHGVSQNQCMARYPSNHVNVAYAPTGEDADRALAVKATTFHKMELHVSLCRVEL